MEELGLSGLIERYVTGDDPGHVIGVYDGGRLVSHACSGLAVIEHDLPLGVDTVLDIASASKHLTASCLLLLQRDGVLSLDDDIRQHLPELALNEAVTFRQCLSHTAGMREYYSLCELSGVPIAGMDEDRLMSLIAGQTDVDFPPGSDWSYSNSGFAIATTAVRRLSGQSLAEFARERLFEPLRMRITRFRDDLLVPVPLMASGYSPAPDGGWRRVDITERTVGDGGIITSLDDLGRWYDFMLTGAVLGSDIRDQLLETAVLTDGRLLSYSLGLEAVPICQHRLHWHSGSIDGFRAALVYLIERRQGVAVMANRDDTFPAEMAMAVARRLCGVEDPPAVPPLDRDKALAAQPAVAGSWYSPALDVHMEIHANEDGTLSQVEHGYSYRFAGESDGSWVGVGHAASMCLRKVGDELWRDRTVGSRWPEAYVRVEGQPPPPAPPPSLPATYFSEELRAHATVATAYGAGPAALEITVGLAPPRTVRPVASDRWAGDGLTVRLPLEGERLEISLDGARRCCFALVAGPAPPRQRGL
ncbi:MAG: serine hydrolase domain-containing protein [Acidimicrobiales bacterium]